MTESGIGNAKIRNALIVFGSPATGGEESQTKSLSISKRADRILVLLWFIYVGVFITLSLLRHYSFTTGLDLAIFDHYVWNFSVGDFVRNSIIGASDIWNYYFAPLLVVFVPFYALWHDARTLLVLQTIALASSVFPIYWYARRQLGSGLAVVIAASFFLYQPSSL